MGQAGTARVAACWQSTVQTWGASRGLLYGLGFVSLLGDPATEEGGGTGPRSQAAVVLTGWKSPAKWFATKFDVSATSL